MILEAIYFLLRGDARTVVKKKHSGDKAPSGLLESALEEDVGAD
jgi:hypothetical protein